MGFFKKKTDPISERAKALNQQIAALEAEIERLSEQQTDKPAVKAQPGPVPPPSSPAASQPRLRSTALPHGHGGSTLQAQPQTPPPPADEPPLEDVNPFRVQGDSESLPDPAARLGVRKSDAPSIWDRVKSNFRATPATNPKLVNYLAAGSIHGLRPLRYEKRIARNRFLLLVVALAVMLWGLLAVLL